MLSYKNSGSILIILTILVSPSAIKAQEVDHQLWLNYVLSVPVNANLSWGGDAGFRSSIGNRDWNQVLIRPKVTYRFNPTWGVAGAVASFNTLNKSDQNVSEFRIHQDLNVFWPELSFLSVHFRLRIEERWFFYEDMSNDFKVRARYFIRGRSPDFLFFGGERPVYFQGSWEGFRTLANESAVEVFIDRSRVSLVFGHRISGSFRYELHYISQRSRQFTDSGLEVSQNIYRLRLFQRLKSKDGTR